MTAATVFRQGWTLDEVHWDWFDPTRVEPGLLAAVKASALVEYNAPDYVIYLKRIFHDAGPQTLAAIEQWGAEESQHGKALGRYAELADPSFKLEETFARFRKGYTPAHFLESGSGSVRGSRRGEMIARCVVESGTSSWYSAIRDASEEPLLREIAGRIAADEYRHYKLFYDTLWAQKDPELSFWKKLMIAVGRVRESDDDELAFAFYCANVKPEEELAKPYNRRFYSKLQSANGAAIYRRKHIQKLVQMVVKAVGADPHGWMAGVGEALVWRRLQKNAASA